MVPLVYDEGSNNKAQTRRSLLVYAIICQKCKKAYIGETKRMLAERFREHLRYVKSVMVIPPLAQHFCLPQYCTDDMKVSVLRECNTNTEIKRKEMEIIFKMVTLHPQGINIDFSYNV